MYQSDAAIVSKTNIIVYLSCTNIWKSINYKPAYCLLHLVITTHQLLHDKEFFQNRFPVANKK